MPTFYRDWEVYVDSRGRSDIDEQFARLAKSNLRATRMIHGVLRTVCREPDIDALLGGRWVKKPSATVYVLRAQSGPFGYRLPFFVPQCREGKLIVLTHCVKRALLTPQAYAAMIDEAERRREDWIERKCEEDLESED